jgi:hypothetical protein
MSKLVFGMAGSYDFTSVAKEDRHWLIPYGSIMGSHREDKVAYFATEGEAFEVDPYLNAYTDRLLTGIEMGQRGEIAHIWDQPQRRQPTPALATATTPNRAEVVKLLAQLGELKAQGVLTEAEFAEQKKKLLAQL